MGLSINNYPSDLYALNQTAGQKRAKFEQENGNISFQGTENDSFELSNKQNYAGKNSGKVSFGEGAKLVGKGFWNKICDIGKSIVEHPLKTLATVGVTTLALAALPLIGITAATGGAILALGFAAYAGFNTVKDVSKAVKHNKEGNYDAVRQDLQKIGGDGVDLALSLPFVPKAINQVKRFTKYGTSSLGLNSELIANLKNVKNVADVRFEFAKAKTMIDYDMITNEIGLSVKPKLVFVDLPAKANEVIIGGAYNPLTGEMQINKNLLYGKGKLLAKMSKIDPETTLRHELEHFSQFSDVARTEGLGIEGLSNAVTEYYTKLYKSVPASELDQLEKLGYSRESMENMINGDKSAFNREFYQQVVNSKGTISSGTAEAERAQEYVNGLLEKVEPKAEHIDAFNEACRGLNQCKPFDAMKIKKAQIELYKKNILEKEAYDAQDIFYNKNIKMRPGVVINNLEALSAVTDNKIDNVV